MATKWDSFRRKLYSQAGINYLSKLYAPTGSLMRDVILDTKFEWTFCDKRDNYGVEPIPIREENYPNLISLIGWVILYVSVK